MAMEEMHGHTSNSAEVHNYCDDVLVYSNVLDGHETYPKEGPGLLIDRKYDIMSTHMTITVGEEFLHINNNCGVSCSYQSPYLFTLRGQKPTYGNVNYNIIILLHESSGVPILLHFSYRCGTVQGCDQSCGLRNSIWDSSNNFSFKAVRLPSKLEGVYV